MRSGHDPDENPGRDLVYDLPLVKYDMCTKFCVDWSNGADFYKEHTHTQTHTQTEFEFYILDTR